VLAFKEFSWAGYLPQAFEISAQDGSATPPRLKLSSSQTRRNPMTTTFFTAVSKALTDSNKRISIDLSGSTGAASKSL
jgi:hypothetical protein